MAHEARSWRNPEFDQLPEARQQYERIDHALQELSRLSDTIEGLKTKNAPFLRDLVTILNFQLGRAVDELKREEMWPQDEEAFADYRKALVELHRFIQQHQLPELEKV